VNTDHRLFTTAPKRLGILTSHPIQYQAPWFRALAKVVDLEVFFAHRQTASEQGNAGFGVAFDWDVDLLSGYSHRFLENVSKNPGVNHFSGCDTPEIKQIIRDEKLDAFIVCGWCLKSYWQAVRACRRARVPVLVRGDSQLATPRSRLFALVKEVVYRIALRQFDGLLAVGKRNREYLEHYGVSPEKIFSAPHFVDNEWFAQQARTLKAQRAVLRRGLKIPDDAFCVLFCGKFIPKKRPLDLVEAARLLMEDGKLSNLHLLFVGSGELGTELRANCDVRFDAEAPVCASQPSTLNSQLTSLPRASFAGFKNQSELPAIYAAADVLVLPSESETWGLVVNEAMACGLRAIVSDAVGCAPDLIEEGKTGFTFALGQPSQLAGRLGTWAKMKSAGHDFVPALEAKLRNYNLETAVRGTLQAAEELARRRN
jgi:glycosyltransferase involved in cell wall biosynthesis